MVFAALAWGVPVQPATGLEADEARQEVQTEGEAPRLEGRAEVQKANPEPPSRFARWRASVFVSGGLTVNLSPGTSVQKERNGEPKSGAFGTIGLGLYPWRWAGFELRWVGTSEPLRDFPTSGLSVPGVDVHDHGSRSVAGGGPEFAAVARSGIFEPWVSVGYWSGTARATVDGHDATATCYWIVPPFFNHCDYADQSWSVTRAVPSGATLGAGVRISPWDTGGLTFGVDFRRILTRPVTLEVVGVQAMPSRTFVTFTLGLALGGPSTRPAPGGEAALP
jgi:hypothetical protein